jgi:hypothetical protein
MPKPWEMDPIDEETGEAPWAKDPDDAQAPFSALRGSKIEAQPSLLSRIGSQVKGFAQELPLIASRGVGLAQDLAHGNAPWDATVAAERASREAKINEWLGAAKPGEPEQRVGRIAARMVPGAAAAYLTGGMSLPAQGLIQGGVQGLQSLSEGASPEAALTGAALAGVAPGAGKFINKGASFVKAPFAKSVDQGIVQAAERAGVELPASAITNSSRARGLEQMASRMMGGAPIEERGLKALDDISGKAAGMGADANPMLAGQRTASEYGAERASLQGIKNAEYGKVGDLTGIPANPEQTLGELDRLIQQGTLDPDTLANLKKLREAIAPKMPEEAGLDFGKYVGDPKMEALIRGKSGGPAPTPQPRSVADLMSQQAGIEYGGPNALRDAGLGNRLRENLGRDITGTLEGAAPDQAAQLATAKKAYGNYADLSQSELGKTVSSFGERGQFDQIPKALLRPSASATDLQRLMDVVGPETQDQLRLTVLKQIVGNAEKVTPKQIERGLNAWGKKASIVLKPEQIQQLRDLSTLSKAMAKTTVGSPTAPLWQAKKYLDLPARGLTALLTGSGAGALGVAGEAASEAAVARLIGSKGGQRWLTKGFGPAVIPGRAAQAASVPLSRIPSEVEKAKREQELLAVLQGR